jgi:hypothetical protein
MYSDEDIFHDNIFNRVDKWNKGYDTEHFAEAHKSIDKYWANYEKRVIVENINIIKVKRTKGRKRWT